MFNIIISLASLIVLSCFKGLKESNKSFFWRERYRFTSLNSKQFTLLCFIHNTQPNIKSYGFRDIKHVATITYHGIWVTILVCDMPTELVLYANKNIDSSTYFIRFLSYGTFRIYNKGGVLRHRSCDSYASCLLHVYPFCPT